ncbi:hypothetical protein [Paracoccus ravus]|uniref:hypothetical protein n=1 Tax=Paracoccus ravus TaxID=2447760 RepID=UPI00106EE5A2|nr:hypothetical protein [Paracoccus ravus]
MNRNEFVVATAVILFAVFLLGWLTSWLIGRLSRVTRAELGELEDMAQQLHKSEKAREEAILALELREDELRTEMGRLRIERDNTKAQLRESRREIEELREYIDRKLGRH